MWYFTDPVLICLRCGILNALWHEQYLPDDKIDGET